MKARAESLRFLGEMDALDIPFSKENMYGVRRIGKNYWIVLIILIIILF